MRFLSMIFLAVIAAAMSAQAYFEWMKYSGQSPKSGAMTITWQREYLCQSALQSLKKIDRLNRASERLLGVYEKSARQDAGPPTDAADAEEYENRIKSIARNQLLNDYGYPTNDLVEAIERAEISLSEEDLSRFGAAEVEALPVFVTERFLSVRPDDFDLSDEEFERAMSTFVELGGRADDLQDFCAPIIRGEA